MDARKAVPTEPSPEIFSFIPPRHSELIYRDPFASASQVRQRAGHSGASSTVSPPASSACLMASGLARVGSYVTVTIWLRRSTWTFSTPAARLALAVTRGTQLGQVTVGTRNLTTSGFADPGEGVGTASPVDTAEVRAASPLAPEDATEAQPSRRSARASSPINAPSARSTMTTSSSVNVLLPPGYTPGLPPYSAGTTT